MNNENEDIIAKNKNKQMKPTETPPDANCDLDTEECETMEPPEDFDGEMPSDLQDRGLRGKEFMMQPANPETTLHPAIYLAIGGGSVILGILVSYVCFSRFFRLKPDQTFSALPKFIWFVVVVLVIATGICLLGYFAPTWG